MDTIRDQELEEQIISKVEAAREARLKAEHKALLYSLAPKKRSDRVAEVRPPCTSHHKFLKLAHS